MKCFEHSAWNFRQSFHESSASGGYLQGVVAVVVVMYIIGAVGQPLPLARHGII